MAGLSSARRRRGLAPSTKGGAALVRNAPEHESPDEQASARFYASLPEERSGPMVIANAAGTAFYWICNLCAGPDVRKAPRRYGDWAEAQGKADEHNLQHGGMDAARQSR